MKLAELALAMVPGLVEDERVFSAMNVNKSSRMPAATGCRTPTSVQRSGCSSQTVASFPYKEAYDAWRRGAGKRGRYQLGNHGRV